MPSPLNPRLRELEEHIYRIGDLFANIQLSLAIQEQIILLVSERGINVLRGFIIF